MMKKADLNPPLGKPGGPCHLMDRIRDQVDDQRLEDALLDEVESGNDLTNEQAAKVYPLTHEQGVGIIQDIAIGPHAEYRMDLRSITVADVRQAIASFLKEFNDGKARKGWQHDQWSRSLKQGGKIEYLSPKNLMVVFVAPRPNQVRIVTTYWKGVPDPKNEAWRCHMAGYQAPVGELSGVRLKERPPNGDHEKQQVLPSPEHSRSKPTGTPSFNGPPASGGGGESVRDKARTQPSPGEDSPRPSDIGPAQNTIVRRPAIRADLVERDPVPTPPGQKIDRASPRRDDQTHDPLPGMEPPAVFDNPGSAKVIPDNRDFVNHKNRVAVRISEIINNCDADLQQKATRVPVRLRRVDTANHLWLFDAEGKSGTHRVRIKAVPKGNTTAVAKMDVLVSCSCPYWQWQGPEHHAVSHTYLYGRPRGTASRPVIKDPAGKHWACHHVLSVLADVSNAQIARKKEVKKLAALLEDEAVGRVARRYIQASLRRSV